jgi:hypothetical protein
MFITFITLIYCISISLYSINTKENLILVIDITFYDNIVTAFIISDKNFDNKQSNKKCNHYW